MFFAIYGIGLDPLAASILVFVFATADALFDIPAAFLLGKTLRRLRGMFLWVAVATPICALFLVLCFLILPSEALAIGMSAYIAIGLVYRLAFTFVDIPLNASIGRFEYNSERRTLVSGGRSIASTAAKVVIGVCTAIFVEQEGRIITGNLWFIAALVGLLACITILPSFTKIDRHSYALEQARQPHQRSEKLLFNAPRMFPRDFIYLLLVNLFFLVGAMQFSHMIIFFVDNDQRITISFGYLWILINIVSSATVFLWMKLAAAVEKVFAIRIALVATIGIVALFLLLRTGNTSAVVLFTAFAGVFHVNALIWALLPDIVDQASANARLPAHAPVVGVFAAIGKIGIGVSHLLTGLILASAGVPNTPDSSALVTYTAVATILGCAASALLVTKIRVTHRHHAKLMRSTQIGPD